MMVPEAMMAVKPMVPTQPMGTSPCVPYPHAGHEQHCQHHDDSHPRGWAASALLSLSHSVSPPRLPACVFWQTPLLPMERDCSTDRRACRAGAQHAVGASRLLVTVCVLVDRPSSSGGPRTRSGFAGAGQPHNANSLP